ncbi:PilT protein domain protein [Spirochaeta thermophila DSM 6578]|uniref:PilT protein domain protein n=1 Tax=Winmispira thermophila (strain ATCC 700085 / DSM 6578 / Z-1203) TaxID=869211 RepID=G0GES5_WINT7|nr:PIN domain-containing protein [Spirochaeta thermophila]AEJ61481.1 PilT protein domain protein [Spirochaeta thermophila DSM 6578]
MAWAVEQLQQILNGRVVQKPKVALDTCCVQYYIGDPPAQPWADCLDPVFRAALDGRIELYVSTVVVSELLAHVHFAHRNTGYDPELDLLAILDRHFQVLDVNGDVARAAGRLRGTFVPGKKMSLKTPDALIGATSITNGHTLFITNDAQLAQALPAGTCVYLKELALEWLAENFPRTCFDTSKTIKPVRRGPGLADHLLSDTNEFGGVKLKPSVTCKRILADAWIAAAAINEACVFFVLTQRNGRKEEAAEVLFWQEALEQQRAAQRIVRYLREYLEVQYDRGKDRYLAALHKHAYGFVFTSLNRERARQLQPCFASKSDHQREADALKAYLTPLWRFRSALTLPGTTWFLCENGEARYLKPAETQQFLDKANNVLGWEGGR